MGSQDFERLTDASGGVDPGQVDREATGQVNSQASGAKRCPLCANENQCGIAAGDSSCWCFTKVIPTEAFDKVLGGPQPGAHWDPAEVNFACVCSDCVDAVRTSPCNHDCALDRVKQTCGGCSRTMREITNWARMDAVERTRVLQRIRSDAS